jgi:hypothetical protein
VCAVFAPNSEKKVNTLSKYLEVKNPILEINYLLFLFAIVFAFSLFKSSREGSKSLIGNIGNHREHTVSENIRNHREHTVCGNINSIGNTPCVGILGTIGNIPRVGISSTIGNTPKCGCNENYKEHTVCWNIEICNIGNTLSVEILRIYGTHCRQ